MCVAMWMRPLFIVHTHIDFVKGLTVRDTHALTTKPPLLSHELVRMSVISYHITAGYSRDDAHHGHAEAVVEAEDTLGAPGGLGEAVPQPVEVALAGADIGGEASTAIRMDSIRFKQKKMKKREEEGGGGGNGTLEGVQQLRSPYKNCPHVEVH